MQRLQNLRMDLGHVEATLYTPSNGIAIHNGQRAVFWKMADLGMLEVWGGAVWNGIHYKGKVMGRSKGGKHSKGKGKFNLVKNETSHVTPESLHSTQDSTQTSYDIAGGLGGFKEKSPDPQTSASYRYTETELEEFLLIKLEDLYTRAKDWLLKSGYGMADVERAILSYGHIHGPKDFLNNILANTVAYIKQNVVPKRRAFKDMDELYKAMLECMIDSALQTERNLKRSEALWRLLVRKWSSIPPIISPPGVFYEDNIKDGSSGITSHCSNEGSSAPSSSSTSDKTQSAVAKKVRVLERIKNSPALASKIRLDMPILIEHVQREIGTLFVEKQYLHDAACALVEGPNLVDPEILTFLDKECVKRWQEISPDDMKTALVIDLMKNIRDLEEKVKLQKEWAEKKVLGSAKRLKDLLELNMLRLEKMETEGLKDEKLSAENSGLSMLKETEESLKKVNFQASNIGESIRILEACNAHIRADTEAVRLSASEYGNKLNQVLKRETRCMKKLASIGKQTSNLRANCDEEKQKALQLQLDVFHAENEAKEAEDRWEQEIKEKEQMLALLAEETRKAGPYKANLKAELSELRRKIELDRNLKKDEVQCLERELSRLRIFQQFPNVSLEGDRFLYNGIEIASLERPDHWKCMICCINEISIVFMPCTHQVLCSSCYEGSCSSSRSRQRCPYCGAEIEQCIKAYAPS